jgi:glutamate racemase
MSSANEQFIGVFDSGVGGLTVLKALTRALPQESTVYLGDTARVPYGTKSADVVTRYSLANAKALMQFPLKMVVVACNTASASALPALQRALPVPVIGVIEPGAATAASVTRNKRIAVIGTPGTIATGAYQRALAAVDGDLQVTALACPLFVPLAEEGLTEGDIATLVAKRYLGDGALHDCDTLVLGCTHYPLLAPVIQSAVGSHVTLVDSAEATARRAASVLRTHHLLSTSNQWPTRHYLVTDTAASFERVAGQFLGQPVSGARQIDL